MVMEDRTPDYKSNGKYHGLHIDPQLSFKDHIDHVVKQLNIFFGGNLSCATFITENVSSHVLNFVSKIDKMVYSTYLQKISEFNLKKILTAFKGDFFWL